MDWRLWDESHFPPPEDDQPRLNRPEHRQNQANPPNPQRNSASSSSSNGAPSEPTIDLSAWSPRSRQLAQIPDIPRQNQTPKPMELRGPSLEPKNPEGVVLLGFSVSSDRMLAVKHGNQEISATGNPDLALISKLLSAYLTPTPNTNPIAINFFCSLRTVNNHTVIVGVAQGNYPDLAHAMLLVLGKSEEKIFKGAPSLCTRSKSTLNFPAIYGSNPAQDEGPFLHQITSPLKAHDSQIAGLVEDPHAPSSHQYPVNAKSPLSLPLMRAQSCLSLCDKPHVSPRTSFFRPQQSAPQVKIRDLIQADLETQQLNPEAQLTAIKDHIIDTSTAVERNFSATPPPSALSSMTKEKRAPTRRSPRLQAKQQFNVADSRQLMKTKSQSCKINFTPNSHLTPLDASKMLEILQATGLLINKQIEDLIDEAVKSDQAVETLQQLQLSLTQDQQAEPSHHDMPTTPLHDAIPPLPVPGTEMLL